ncbi:AgmX/PglI C-terminal domain-containing protein [Myxococcota bacterium]|jgi:hypothetical protein|nr:AgmX/PglI C-terminal domain-containing protein [Myxococcota bacterium]MBU1411560.1 AgmX/PglI C-terminal domain-containing protein [Myxococcota bacterium]MBU1511475.1 AgmX/PglI C-terminal domain-containing protein [Myxococcota bacterium]
MKLYPILLALLTLNSCTDKKTTSTPVKEPEPVKTEVKDPEKINKVVIEGDLGTIDEAMVQKKFAESRDQVSACVHKGLENAEYVGGDFFFTFRIALDGTVKTLDMKSTVGHRDIETCIYGFAKALQFPKPEGGEALVNFSWSFNSTMDVQHQWDANRLGNAYPKLRSKLIRCSDGTNEAPSEYQVIFFVLPDAELGPVGVSSGKTLPSDKFYKCVHSAIKGAKLPDPLGSVARVVLPIAP